VARDRLMSPPTDGVAPVAGAARGIGAATVPALVDEAASNRAKPQRSRSSPAEAAAA